MRPMPSRRRRREKSSLGFYLKLVDGGWQRTVQNQVASELVRPFRSRLKNCLGIIRTDRLNLVLLLPLCHTVPLIFWI